MPNCPIPFDTYSDIISKTESIRRCGIVTESRGLLVESRGPQASIGEICRIDYGRDHHVLAEVVGFRDNRLLLSPLGEIGGVAPGMTVTASGSSYMVGVGPNLLGRVLDGFGKPIDNKGPLTVEDTFPLSGEKINPLTRQRITEPLWTQIRGHRWASDHRQGTAYRDFRRAVVSVRA